MPFPLPTEMLYITCFVSKKSKSSFRSEFDYKLLEQRFHSWWRGIVEMSCTEHR